jgi:putative peptidoglycan lipid II flippase
VLLALLRMGIAALLMAEAAWIVARVVGSNTGAGALGRVVAASIVGLVVYAGALVVMRAPELTQLKSWFTRRGLGGGGGPPADVQPAL